MNIRKTFGIIFCVGLMGLIVAGNRGPCFGFQVDDKLHESALVYPTFRKISGRVIDPDGNAVSGAIVIQSGKSDPTLSNYSLTQPYDVFHQAKTDLFGKFEFDSVELQFPATFVVCHPDFRLKAVHNPLELFGEVELERSSSIDGRILDHSGSGIPGAVLKLRYPPQVERLDFELGSTVTDEKGYFSLPNCSSGQQTIEVELLDKLRFDVSWYPEADEEAPPESPESWNTVRGENCVVRMPEFHSAKLNVVSAGTNRPVPIEKAEVHRSTPNASQGIDDLGVAINGHKISCNYLFAGVNQIKITPKPETDFPTIVANLVIKPGQTSPLELDLKIPPWVRVEGRIVDEVTGRPIADAIAQYLPDAPRNLKALGIELPNFQRTNEDGLFSFVVPEGKARIRVVGECGNYRTLSYGSPDELRPEVAERLERSIDARLNHSVDVDPFQLQTGSPVSGIVVDLDGRPMSDVAFVAKHDNDHYGARSSIVGKTDNSGRFQIDSMYSIVIGDRPDQVPVRGSDYERVRGQVQNKSAEIFFWDEKQALSRNVILGEIPTDPITVQLDTSPIAWGRVIDAVSGAPISGVHIQANSRKSLRLGGVTRQDGSFVIEHLPRAGFTLILKKREYQPAEEYASFSHLEQHNLVLELADITMTKYLAFGIPDPLADISDMRPKQAVAAISAHLQAQLARIPEHRAEGNWSVDDPREVFRIKLMKSLTGPLNDFLDNNPDSELQVQTALAIFNEFAFALPSSQGEESSAFPTHQEIIPSVPVAVRLQGILIENIEREGVFGNYQRYRFGWQSDAIQMRILSNSTNPVIREWVARPMIVPIFWSLEREIARIDSEAYKSEFEGQLKLATQVWRIGLTEFPDVKVDDQSTVATQIQRLISRLEQQLSQPNIDPALAEKFRAAIDELMPERTPF